MEDTINVFTNKTYIILGIRRATHALNGGVIVTVTTLHHLVQQLFILYANFYEENFFVQIFVRYSFHKMRILNLLIYLPPVIPLPSLPYNSPYLCITQCYKNKKMICRRSESSPFSQLENHKTESTGDFLDQFVQARFSNYRSLEFQQFRFYYSP